MRGFDDCPLCQQLEVEIERLRALEQETFQKYVDANEARIDVIEECAKVADDIGGENCPCAAAIRELKI